MIPDSSPPPRSDRASPAAPGRWLWAVVLGVAAAAINTVSVPLLTEETPLFIFGGFLVYLAVALLGMGPGVLAAALMMAPIALGPAGGIHPGVIVGSGIYVVEAAFVRVADRRFGSIVLSTVVFWAVVGWALDLGVYVLWMGVDPSYIALLFTKQVLNAMANACVAELLLTRPILARLPRGLGGGRRHASIRQYVFNRLTLVASIPTVVFGLLYARARYEGDLAEARDESMRLAMDVVGRVELELERRSRDLGRAAMRIHAAGADPAGAQAVLRALVDDADFYAATVTDAADRVAAAWPTTTRDGQAVVGADLSDRAYLAEARETGRTVYSGYRTGGLGFRSESAASVVLAEPLTDPDGRYAGAVIGGLDAGSMHGGLAPPRGLAAHGVTLLDGAGRVLDDSGGSLPPGMAADSLLRRADGSVAGLSLIGEGDAAVTFPYYPPPDGSIASALSLDMVHATYRPIPIIGWGVLVSHPTAALHASFLPSVAWILGLVGMGLVAVVLVAGQFSRRLTRPVRIGAGAAARIAESPFDDVDLAPVRAGGLDELDDLADALDVMRRTLQVRATAVRIRQEELETQLLHAQKMEVIGQLAGGVAHDFNNILTPILAHAEMVLEDVDDPDARASLEDILDAAQRGRSITRQLLAHGRKQVLRVETLDLGAEVRDGRRMLASLLRDDIEVVLDTDAVVPPIRADRTQIQQVLMNLALNAQDAMPGGGRLTLAVREEALVRPDGAGDDRIEAGRYVTISVTDAGEGIAPDDLERIFEPFFTTKAPSRGTGLGLSTVYGIVRQHGGAVRVRSAPGEGTVFRLFFPVVEPSAE